ncbi:MAG: hypothetical protein AAFN70_08715, partial [Planctomycetota bacterium]
MHQQDEFDLVILHGHLMPGGVTNVIAAQIRVLLATDPVDKDRLSVSVDRAFPKRILLLSGPRSKGLDLKTLREVSSVPIEHVPLPRLEYDSVLKEKGAARHDGQSMTAEIHGALQRHDCDPQNTVIHWHNYSLGKNLASPDAVRGLHTLGYRLLLQIHDFAEDNRPANLAYLLQGFGDGDIAAAITDWLYPDLPNVHYACLTYGDTSRVQSLGLCHGSVSTLPNPVLSHADSLIRYPRMSH